MREKQKREGEKYGVKEEESEGGKKESEGDW